MIKNTPKKTRPSKRNPSTGTMQGAVAKKATSSQSKSLKTNKKKSSKAKSAKAVPVFRRRLTPEEIQYKNSVTQFEKGVKHFNRHEFQKARPIFERLAHLETRDLGERAQVYLNICNQRLNHPTLHLKTVDDLYNYGVGMANQGNQEEAERYLAKALKLAPKSDYIYYALASTFALRANVETALEHLEKAIQLNERTRFMARNDPDFSQLEEDPRFTELIYPEKPVS